MMTSTTTPVTLAPAARAITLTPTGAAVCAVYRLRRLLAHLEPADRAAVLDVLHLEVAALPIPA